MNEYYIKKGKKYIPIGLCNINNNLPYGIWYVRKHEGSISYTSVDFWQTEPVLDIKKVCSEIDLADIVLEAIRSLPEKDFSIYNISYYDFAKNLAKKILNNKG